MEFDVLIEIPRGSRNKYEVDHESGLIRMTDEKGGDDKIICVPAGDPRQENLRELEDIPEFYRLEIHHFFTVYKELEPGKSVTDTAWAGRAAAEAEVEASRRRLREAGG